MLLYNWYIQERETSATLFKGKKGQQLARDIGKRMKTFIPGAPVGEQQAAQTPTASGAAQAAAAAASAPASAKQNIEAIKVWEAFESRLVCFYNISGCGCVS